MKKNIVVIISVLAVMLAFGVISANANDSGICGKNLTWEFDDSGTLTISGTGKMDSFSSVADVPWKKYSAKIKSVIIEEGVTSIGSKAFFKFHKITSIDIADSVECIETEAFYDCTSINILTIPKGIKRIEDEAFRHCTDLRTVNFNATNCKYMGSGSDTTASIFYTCNDFSQLYIGEDVSIIPPYAFDGCYIDDIYYAGSLKEWDDKVTISDNNSSLWYARMHYNSSSQSLSSTQTPKPTEIPALQSVEPATPTSNNDITVLLNGTKILFDIPPQIMDGYTMVPMRAIFEGLGYEVEWYQDSQSIAASNGKRLIYMTVNEKYMYAGDNDKYASASNQEGYINTHTFAIDKAPVIVDGRTLVPVRAISETSGYEVNWDGYTRTVSITGESVTPVTYDDSSKAVEQINSYIEQGLYLEAIDLCDDTLSSYKLSQNDKSTINDLKNLAQTKYDDYVSYNEQFTTYRRDDWGMTFKFYKNIKPKSYGNSHSKVQYIDVYRSGGEYISIRSYDIGEEFAWSHMIVSDARSLTNYLVEYHRGMSGVDLYEEGYYDVDFDVLSEIDTNVGTLSAHQATIRTTRYKGRYKTSPEYEITRFTAFKYGDWIYVIEDRQFDNYTWTEDFWDKMELIRTTIGFDG